MTTLWRYDKQYGITYTVDDNLNSNMNDTNLTIIQRIVDNGKSVLVSVYGTCSQCSVERYCSKLQEVFASLPLKLCMKSSKINQNQGFYFFEYRGYVVVEFEEKFGRFAASISKLVGNRVRSRVLELVDSSTLTSTNFETIAVFERDTKILNITSASGNIIRKVDDIAQVHLDTSHVFHPKLVVTSLDPISISVLPDFFFDIYELRSRFPRLKWSLFGECELEAPVSHPRSTGMLLQLPKRSDKVEVPLHLRYQDAIISDGYHSNYKILEIWYPSISFGSDEDMLAQVVFNSFNGLPNVLTIKVPVGVISSTEFQLISLATVFITWLSALYLTRLMFKSK